MVTLIDLTPLIDDDCHHHYDGNYAFEHIFFVSQQCHQQLCSFEKWTNKFEVSFFSYTDELEDHRPMVVSCCFVARTNQQNYGICH